MIYSQFQQSPFQTRFSGSRSWMTFAIGIAVITLTLIALPFVLLFGAISFIFLSLFGRLFMKKQLARFQQSQAERGYSQSESPAQSVFTEAKFGHQACENKGRQGRTFDHDPSES
ncbi:hypothetical protein HQQ94_21290 [Shewanella sp. VB17]|uniref:hypothetical protein n=1 Tax=Shewanella sp. VB17 TaxID=2739432 RepID=UPI0015651AC7|nr:hypothetical protein [Shewanella sp. VB17]NRD75707.1 hypothetical protein [Shewanella sp. VB17]